MNDTEQLRRPLEGAPATGAASRPGDQHDTQLENEVTRGRDGDAAQPGRPGDTLEKPREIGGRKGPDPVRYGDWEKNGRCIDF